MRLDYPLALVVFIHQEPKSPASAAELFPTMKGPEIGDEEIVLISKETDARVFEFH